MECPTCKQLGHTCKKCVTYLRDQVKNLRAALEFNQKGWEISEKKRVTLIKAFDHLKEAFMLICDNSVFTP